ncbi:MAG: YdcF family protein [Oscillospiraceae bacterium]|nr:YdcF family protein [Oscillospiraceae bacterium]
MIAADKNKEDTEMRIIAAFCLTMAAWLLLPLTAGISHIGMYFGAGWMLLLAAVCFFWPRIRAWFSRSRGSLRAAAAVALCILVLLPAALFAVMYAAHTEIGALPRGVTVVVLGCGVNGTEPSAMLRARCEHALAILQRDESAVCIASGGQGPGEDITEAEAIRRYLTARGIDNSRIYLEDTSTDTMQNVQRSLALMAAEGLDAPVVLVSDRFHLCRARMYAGFVGERVLASGCTTMPFLAPGYWVRDMGGVLLLLMGVRG